MNIDPKLITADDSGLRPPHHIGGNQNAQDASLSRKGDLIEQAETRTDEANTRTNQANTRTDEANARADQADARTDLANAQTAEANIRTEQAESRGDVLRASELSYRRLFESARDGILILDADTGRVTDVNPFLVEMLGFPHGEMIGKTVAELSPFKDAVANLAMLERLQKDGYVRYEDLPLETRDGRRIAVEFVSNVYQAGGKDVIQCNIRDITARKQLEKSHKHLTMAVDQAAETIVITDINGTILYANPAFEQSTGYTREEALGQNPRMHKSGKQDGGFYRRMWDVLARGEVWQGHFINRRKDGTLYEEEATISPVRDTAGKVINYVAVKRDVTHEVLLESQFRQSQKMESIGQLAGGIAHDFNNILAVIMMQSEITGRGENLPLKAREGLLVIKAAAERAANLTRQLLLFSRQEIMQPRQLNLNEVVASLAKLLQRIIREDVSLELSLSSKPLTTYADAGMLDQVLMNLVVNASDAMPNGGRLIIETAEKIVDAAVAALNPEASPGQFVWLSVSDTGCGMTPEIQSRIFEPFFTTKEAGKGTGLGLATVFGIVKQHKGWVKVYSEVGKGTTFQVFLPASAGSAEVLTNEATKREPRGGTETVFVVEDDATLRMLTRLMLEQRGYQVLEAPDSNEALRIWPEHQGRIALLLTDLVMPGGVDGRELATRLQAQKPGLKVIFTSGYSAAIAGRELKLEAGQNFIQKPCPADQLLNTARDLLDS